MPSTTNYSWFWPAPNTERDTWGSTTFTALQAVDTDLKTLSDSVGTKAPLASPNFTGTVSSSAFSGPLNGTVTGNVTGNADTATALATARDIDLTGIITATAQSFDGSANVTLTTAIADAALSIAKTSGLQAALDAKEATLNADQKRSITISTSDPSGGSDGDVWLKYTA
ncbi:MAG: hypothetical protein AAF926_06600 [Pseudomonadota bacterium]